MVFISRFCGGRHLREFGKFGNVSYAARFYVEEHYELLIKDNAMQSLAEM